MMQMFQNGMIFVLNFYSKSILNLELGVVHPLNIIGDLIFISCNLLWIK